MTKFRTIQIKEQEITNEQIAAISEFLKNQPKWRMIHDEAERSERKHRFAKTGVDQHWLWREENQATSWDDFIMEWGSSKTPIDERWIKTDRAHLIMPGELFLCDLVGNELWIARLLKRGDKFRAEKIARVCDDMNHYYGNAFNGYALLPLAEIRK